MTLSTNITKIRRFLRDPDSNIWDDDTLLAIWNDEQREYHRRSGIEEAAEVLWYPPRYQMSYIFDHEWSMSGYEDGGVYQFMLEDWQYRCCQPWEIKHVTSVDGEETSVGDCFSHPWEAFMVATPADMVPMNFPSDHYETIFMSYDMEPIEFRPFKEISSGDRSFRTYSGSPEHYTVKDELSNDFFLYPRPSSVTFETYNGFGLDAVAADVTENVLIVYKHRSVDLSSVDDDPVQPRWAQKYLEYGVLEKAYQANTDGRIKSLADYWGWRKSLGDKILRKYKFKRLQDRDFRLTGAMGVPRRHRGPRLPSTYPAV